MARRLPIKGEKMPQNVRKPSGFKPYVFYLETEHGRRGINPSDSSFFRKDLAVPKEISTFAANIGSVAFFLCHRC